MTIARKLALAAVLALALMGLTASTAAATTITVGGQPYDGPIAASGSVAIWTGLMERRCTGVGISGSIESDGSGQITGWTFTGCGYTGSPGIPLTFTVQNLPYDFQVSPNSILQVTEPVSFTESVFGMSCTHPAPNGIPMQISTGYSPDRLSITQFGLGSSYCGNLVLNVPGQQFTAPGNLEISS